MSFLLTLNEKDLANTLSTHFDKYEKLINDAEPLFTLDGMRLELVARNLPYHQLQYDQAAQEAKQIIKWLENYKAKLEARYLKNYSQGQKALGSREITVFINGEPEIVDVHELIIEATLAYQKLDSIVEAFKQMGWMCGHMVKLRVAEIHEAVI